MRSSSWLCCRRSGPSPLICTCRRSARCRPRLASTTCAVHHRLTAAPRHWPFSGLRVLQTTDGGAGMIVSDLFESTRERAGVVAAADDAGFHRGSPVWRLDLLLVGWKAIFVSSCGQFLTSVHGVAANAVRISRRRTTPAQLPRTCKLTPQALNSWRARVEAQKTWTGASMPTAQAALRQ